MDATLRATAGTYRFVVSDAMRHTGPNGCLYSPRDAAGIALHRASEMRVLERGEATPRKQRE